VTKPVFKVAGEIKTPPFSLEARVSTGALLRALQDGESLGKPHSRPMPMIGVVAGCHELRIADEKTIHRDFHAVRPEAIVLLGVLAKKTRTTPPRWSALVGSCRARIRRYDEAKKG